MKMNSNFLHYSGACFFHRVASVNFVQTTIVQFSFFFSSGVPFQVAFYNFSENLITSPQNFDVLMISNQTFTTVPPVIKI